MNKFRFALLIALAVASLQLGPRGFKPTPAAALTNCTVNDLSIDAEEQRALELINAARPAGSPLQFGSALNRAATWHSVDMAVNNRFDHIDSLGRDPGVRLTQCDQPSGSWSENIGAGYVTGQDIFNGWWNSPPHKAAMLSTAYAYVGIARVCCHPVYGWMWTADFSSATDGPPGGGGGSLLAPVITAVTGGSDPTVLNVVFNDRATTEYGFQYERKTGTGGTYALVLSGNGLPGAQSGWFWPNGGLQPATTYCYRIRAFDATVASPYSNEVCAATSGSQGLPAPSGVSIMAGSDPSTLNVFFNDNATTETGFEYQRKTGTGGTYSVVLNGNALPGAQAGWYWPNSGLQAGTTYCYRIRARSGGTLSAYSNEACGTTPGGGGAVAAPSAVSIAAGGAGTLNVFFNDNATTETGFEYQRRVGQNGNWGVVLNGNALPGAQAGWYWPNSGLNSGTQYCYRIRAKNGGTFSSFSNTACGTAP